VVSEKANPRTGIATRTLVAAPSTVATRAGLLGCPLALATKERASGAAGVAAAGARVALSRLCLACCPAAGLVADRSLEVAVGLVEVAVPVREQEPADSALARSLVVVEVSGMRMAPPRPVAVAGAASWARWA